MSQHNPEHDAVVERVCLFSGQPLDGRVIDIALYKRNVLILQSELDLERKAHEETKKVLERQTAFTRMMMKAMSTTLIIPRTN